MVVKLLLQVYKLSGIPLVKLVKLSLLLSALHAGSLKVYTLSYLSALIRALQNLAKPGFNCNALKIRTTSYKDPQHKEEDRNRHFLYKTTDQIR